MFILFFCSVLFGSGRPLADLNLCLVLFLLLFGVCLLQCSRWKGVKVVIGEVVLRITLKGQVL